MVLCRVQNSVVLEYLPFYALCQVSYNVVLGTYRVGYNTESSRVLTVSCIVFGIVSGTIQCSVVIT